MQRSLLFVLVSVMTACGVGVAHGKDCQGVNVPEQVQLDGGTLTLNGLGLRQATILKVNVYVAALYVAKVSSDAARAARVEHPQRVDPPLPAQRERRRPQEGLGGGLVHNAKAQLPALHERIEMLKSWMADMQSGQRLTFIHKPGAGIQVDVNGTVQGHDHQAMTSRPLSLHSGCGAHPPNAGLKSGRSLDARARRLPR